MLPADWRKRFRGRWSLGRLLAPETTFRIGGPAQLYLEPESVTDLVESVVALRRIGMPYRILGGGSNLLVADRGVEGAVLSLARLRQIKRSEGRITADGGARLSTVVRVAAEQGLSGLEPFGGIPGTVGGAVFGNAGSKYGAIGPRVLALELLRPEGQLERVVPSGSFFGYRHSLVGDSVVLRVELSVEPGDRERVGRRTQDIVRERNRTQPGWVGNAGCVFKNPPGASAGRLIDDAGCKGLTEGRIRVSRRHANFFENVGGGRAESVQCLIDRVRKRVRRASGAELELEVRRWL